MKILELNKPIELGAVVRTAPTVGDNLILKLRNEFSNLLIEIPIVWSESKGRLVFSFDTQTDFKAGNKYQLEIYNDTESQTIYFGKLLVVKEDTNIQNYTPSTQRTQRFKSKA
jgi:hypothetical protein